MRSLLFLLVVLGVCIAMSHVECASKIRPKRAVHASSSSSSSTDSISTDSYESYATNYAVPSVDPYDTSSSSSSDSGYSSYESNYGPTSTSDPYESGSTINSGSSSWDTDESGDHRPRKWPRVGNSTALDFWEYSNDSSDASLVSVCALGLTMGLLFVAL